MPRWRQSLRASTDSLPRTPELKGSVWSADKTLLDRAREATVVRADLAPLTWYR
ncbi:hypothetical protein ACIPY6_40215 [Streptomyces sp. NPDC090054]|uniref:hypothetical protein n=1 Tax=Streptomyces sp. NPDC090054 TaxID=3365933 RepID=UPI0037FCFE00